MKFLCLHGAGTNAKILESQLRPLLRELQRDDNSISFHVVEGDIECPPDPAIEGFFSGPFYSYFDWPRTMRQENDDSLFSAFDLLYATIEEHGPFDGILGFSHGGVLAASFLAQHAKENPYDSPLFRCAVFMSSFPPFRMDDDGETPVFDEEMEGKITIPTLHVAGEKDFVYKHSISLYNICNKANSALFLHGKGHEVPTGVELVKTLSAAVKDLKHTSMFY